jgi:hypothetical protein
MTAGLRRSKLRGIQQSIVRGVIVCTFAAMLAISLELAIDAEPVAAAAVSATIHQDRRPDRERSVGTTSSGEQSSSSSSSGRGRPRIVRR